MDQTRMQERWKNSQFVYAIEIGIRPNRVNYQYVYSIFFDLTFFYRNPQLLSKFMTACPLFFASALVSFYRTLFVKFQVRLCREKQIKNKTTRKTQYLPALRSTDYGKLNLRCPNLTSLEFNIHDISIFFPHYLLKLQVCFDF